MPKEPEAKSNGPWDVAMHMAKQFPMFALFMVLLVAAYFGIQMVLEQRDRAQRELIETRLQIEAERERANKALAEAAEKEKLAFQKVQQADAEALRSVQETMLKTAERVQSLVSGQLDTMETLEKLRKTNAQEMEARLNDVVERQKAAVQRVKDAEERVKLAEFNFTVEKLEDSINQNPSNWRAAATDFIKLLDIENEDVLVAFNSRLEKSQSTELRASLEYSIAKKSLNATYRKQFVETLRMSMNSLSKEWLESLVSCCEDIDSDLWQMMLPAVVSIVEDGDIDNLKKISLIEFFARRPSGWKGPMFVVEKNYANDLGMWKVMEFMVDVIKNKHPSVHDYQRLSMISKLLEFDPAITHVWANKILENGNLDREDAERLRKTIEGWAKQYQGFDKKPLLRFVNFWSTDKFSEKLSNYSSLRTEIAYKTKE